MESRTSARAHLGAVLRSAREALQPQDVGLPPRERARTPGLRREDVAELAGISETYYAWLEQGRVERPTARVIRRVARALRLPDSEERRLVALALGLDPSEESYAVVASERLAAFLDGFSNRCWRVQSFEEMRKLLMDGLHQEGQLTFFRHVTKNMSSFVDCRGIGSEQLRGQHHALEGPKEHNSALVTLLSGEVLAVSDISDAAFPLTRTLMSHNLRCVIEVSIRLFGEPIAIVGYAERNPREHSAIERHLLKAVATLAGCVLAGNVVTRACDLRRSLHVKAIAFG